jgi:uncharacterized protein with FMN-binding domain
VSARVTVGGVVASAAIIAIAWQVGQSTATASTAAPLSTSSGRTTTTTAPSNAASPSAPASAGTSAGTSTGTSSAAKDGTYTGDAIQTPFGNMEVAIVVSSSKITDVKVLQATDRGQRSVQISSYADPILRTEVLQAQSANVQMVSGATYTSDGYLQSLQSALDKAGL